MNAWNTLYGEGLKVRYHIWGVEDGIESDFVDVIQIYFDDGYQMLVKYYAEEGILFIYYNGNKLWFYTIAPGFTYLNVVEGLTAEELVSLVRHEISYLLSSLLS